MDYELLKYRVGFFTGLILVCILIFFECQNRDLGLREWDYKPNRIEKVVITRYEDNSRITMTDSSEFKPLLKNIVNSIKVRNVESRSSNRMYTINIHYRDNSQNEILYYLSRNNIFYFNVYSSYYINDSLNNELKELHFPDVIIKNPTIVF
jgi:hypothetical protein